MCGFFVFGGEWGMCSGTSCTRPFGRLRRHQSFPTIGRTTGALTLTLQKFYLTHKKTRNMCGFFVFGGEWGMCSGTSCTRPFGRLRRHKSLPTIGRTTGALTLTLQRFYFTHKKTRNMCGFFVFGGEWGIRTPGGFDPTSDFKSGALNRALPTLLKWCLS